MAKRSSKKSSKPVSSPSSNKQSYSLGGIIVTLLLVLIYWGMTGSLPNVATPESTDANAPVVANADIEIVQAPATLAPLATETPPAVALVAVATEVASEEEATAAAVAQEELFTATAIPTDPPPTAVPATATPAPTATATTPPRPTATATNPPRAGPRGMPEIYLAALPPEALETIDLIFADGPFPFDRDGIIFQNREGLLPNNPRGYYREFTVITPGASTRGARRIIAGDDGELYYTDDHYESFSWVVLP